MPSVISTTETCQNNLQLFATTLADLEQISFLRKQFKKSPLSSFICIEVPLYVPMIKLSCSHEKTQAIICDESMWQSIAKSVDSRFLGLLYPFGGANVHFGILYFDRADNIDILTHEILHLLGFIDEYPLPESHSLCQKSLQEMFSHNIVVLDKLYKGNKKEIRTKILQQIPWAKKIKSSTPILSKVALLPDINSENIDNASIWQLGTPKLFEDDIGVFNADSCESQSFRAFKPVFKRTQLLYYETPLPSEYLAFLSNKPQQFLMPSFHYNIAMALFRNDNMAEGKKWLLKAVNFESNENRRMKVLRAQF